MESFKQRMQPIVDAMPAGNDKQTLQALIDYQDSMIRPEIPPPERAKILRDFMRTQRKAVMNVTPPPAATTGAV